MCNDDEITIINNSNLNKKSDYKFLLLYTKLSETTYYQRNRNVILYKAKEYYKTIKKD